ncbi:MAG TPA: hypothetical protein VJ978_01250 [Nitriliruptoraceae bacterium]|nr:hypothetical protein [Nitriliruptoraceae bacterium]
MSVRAGSRANRLAVVALALGLVPAMAAPVALADPSGDAPTLALPWLVGIALVLLTTGGLLRRAGRARRY